MNVYYNDNDRGACAWLRELIKAKLIPDGVVDQRSILEINPDELRQYDQCHFFAGIGGWAYALILADWEGPVWTGSCPCQPFSAAGKRAGVRDHRDLWGAFRDLIAICRPATVFGEQVASADGRLWLARVRTDVEGVGYALGAGDLCSAGVGSPNIRQRIYWVAHTTSRRGLEERNAASQGEFESSRSGGAIGLADARCGIQGRGPDESRKCAETDSGRAEQSGRCGSPGGLADATSMPSPEQRGKQGQGLGREAGSKDSAERGEPAGRLGDAVEPGLEGHPGDVHDGSESGRLDQGAERPAASPGVAGGTGDAQSGGRGELRDASLDGARRHIISPSWARFDLVPCRDGKTRRFEPGSFPLAHGLPGRVGLLRGYGNAINPWVAKEFIESFKETLTQSLT